MKRLIEVDIRLSSNLVLDAHVGVMVSGEPVTMGGSRAETAWSVNLKHFLVILVIL